MNILTDEEKDELVESHVHITWEAGIDGFVDAIEAAVVAKMKSDGWVKLNPGKVVCVEETCPHCGGTTGGDWPCIVCNGEKFYRKAEE